MKQFNNSFHSKKSLGQHFLTSKTVAQNLLAAAKIVEDDVVFEVGPGRGFITEELLKVANKVVAIEKDEQLADFLKQRFAEEIKSGQLTIIPADILKFPFSSYNLQATSYKLIGSIPYYITGKFFRTILENPAPPKTLAVIIQKEVAERIVARDGKENLLSLGVKAFGSPHYVSTVPARFFRPPPKVSSAILVVENISRDFFDGHTILPEQFFKVLRAGFAHKRKILISSLKEGFGMEKDALARAFIECGIEEKARPEDISLQKWGCLAQKIIKHTAIRRA